MRTIDDVLQRLDEIVERCSQEQNRAGYFAALYRQMTAAVQVGIETGRFADADRMERLDVVFATRYVDAFDAYYSGHPCTRSWQAAFDAAGDGGLCIIQQLMLGVNAHINLDLGIAAAEVAPGTSLPQLKSDFDEINTVIASLVDHVLADIGDISPWIRLLDLVSKKEEDVVVNFSINIARKEAWRLAEQVAIVGPSYAGPVIGLRDTVATALARVVRRPGILGGFVTRVIAAREVKQPAQVIAALSEKLQAAPTKPVDQASLSVP